MNGKRKSVRRKKGGILLALALSVGVMFGNSMTAEAAEIKLVDGDSLQVGQELQGGDVISKTSYTSCFKVLIDGRTELEEWNTSNYAYTLPAGEKISFDTGRLYTLSDSIIKKLAERNDVSAEITFEYQGKNYKMTIPAGADYTAILGDEENFYGYFYFAQLIGATIEEI